MTTYKIGNCKPPKHTSGKASPAIPREGLKALPAWPRFFKELSRKIEIVDPGKQKTVSKMEATVKQLIHKAMSGDIHAIRLLSMLAQVWENSGTRQTPAEPEEADRKVLQSLMTRIGAGNQ